MSFCTAPQRRYIEDLAAGYTDEELVELIRKSGHAGKTADGIYGSETRNQALKRLSRRQASALIDMLRKMPRRPAPKPKPRPKKPEFFLRVEDPEPLSPVEVEVLPELANE